MGQTQADLSIYFSIDFLQAYGQNIAGWQLFRQCDRFPAAKWRVKYKILKERC